MRRDAILKTYELVGRLKRCADFAESEAKIGLRAKAAVHLMQVVAYAREIKAIAEFEIDELDSQEESHEQV